MSQTNILYCGPAMRHSTDEETAQSVSTDYSGGTGALGTNASALSLGEDLEQSAARDAEDSLERLVCARASRDSNTTLRASSTRTVTSDDHDAGTSTSTAIRTVAVLAVVVEANFKRKHHSAQSDSHRPKATRRRDRLATEEPSSQSASDAMSTDDEDQAQPPASNRLVGTLSDDHDMVLGMRTLQ